MKKLILFVSLLLSTNSFAEELQTFEQIKETVTTGKTINIAIDFSKCTSNHKTIEHVAIGVFTPNSMFVSNNRIATSLTHFSLNNPKFPDKPVYEFVKYTITNDGNVNLSMQVLNAKDYEVMSDKTSYDCKIGSAAKIYG